MAGKFPSECEAVFLDDLPGFIVCGVMFFGKAGYWRWVMK
jgi:hypothetical protein